MKTQTFINQSFEFYFPDVDTLLLAEHRDGKVLIRATKNTFGELRKINFIHHLASEGFIPDYYRWLSNLDPAWSNLCWRVDYSWLKTRQTTTRRTTKVMIGLLASAIALWMGGVILSDGQNLIARASSPSTRPSGERVGVRGHRLKFRAISSIR